MNPEQRENLRLGLLIVLEANNTRFGVPERAMPSRLMTAQGVNATADEIAAELQYLADASLVETMNKVISPENRTWRITKAGRDHLAERGY